LERYDVLVCGFGPVGALLAARLGAAGMSVLVVERSPELFALPRAVAADGEVLEILDRTAPGLTDGFLRDPAVRFVSADGQQLGRLQFPVPGLAFFRQPVLERRLRTHIAGLPSVRVRLGVTLGSFGQDPDGVTARVAGEPVRADWLVGCDGATSGVRQALGLDWLGRDLPHRWLVCDVEGPPVPGRQLFTYTCDPARPQVDLPVPGGHRWEWLLRDGAAGSTSPLPAGDTGLPPKGASRATVLLARDTDPAPLRVVREVEYRFSARRAASWQVGRVLLAGDAAHTLPPFAGQGLGAGLRDAWALGALLPRAELTRYERLRAPHVRRMTTLSQLLGSLLQIGSPCRARGRDALLRKAFAAPGLGAWLRRGGPRPDVSGVLEL